MHFRSKKGEQNGTERNRQHAFHSEQLFHYIRRGGAGDEATSIRGDESSALRKYFCQIFFVQFICKTAKRQIVHIC